MAYMFLLLKDNSCKVQQIIGPEEGEWTSKGLNEICQQYFEVSSFISTFNSNNIE